MSLFKRWQTATIAISGTTSGEIDLEADCDLVEVIFPTMTAGTISITVSDKSGGTFVALGTGQTTASISTACAITMRLGGYQFIKIVSSGTQASARTLDVRGIKL